MMLIFVIVISYSFLVAQGQEKIECTDGLKAKATIEFSECQESLLPVKWCHELFRDTLYKNGKFKYDQKYPNKTHEDEYCQIHKKLTSCEYLTHLTGVCGASYDTCHSVQEKREIMRMWIKQFIRGTHEIYWEGAFADDIQEIFDGKCNAVLDEYFNDEEVAEIIRLTNSGPNSYKEEIIEVLDNYRILKNTKVSNLSQDFGVLKDMDGNRIGYPNGYPFLTKPSHWKYCSWKMKHNIDEEDLFYALPNLFHCDGKCNTNDGDNQEWMLGSLGLNYIDVKTDETHRDNYPNFDPLQGDDSMFSCIWKAGWSMQDNVADNVADLDKAKMELCKPFKTVLTNCSIPINECIGDIGVKEIVMAEVLKEMVGKVTTVMEIVEKHTTPHYLGDFSYKDCVIFGGDVAGSTVHLAHIDHIILSSFLAYILI